MLHLLQNRLQGPLPVDWLLEPTAFPRCLPAGRWVGLGGTGRACLCFTFLSVCKSHCSLVSLVLRGNPLGGLLPTRNSTSPEHEAGGSLNATLNHLDLEACSLTGNLPESWSTAPKLAGLETVNLQRCRSVAGRLILP